SGLATMGYALPAAIAAALCLQQTRGAPGAPVLAFTGDGGLGMTLAEIETAVRLSLRVIVIVFNDAALSLIKIKQKPAGHGGDEAVRYRPVSFAAAAAAMGAAGAAGGRGRGQAGAAAGARARAGRGRDGCGGRRGDQRAGTGRGAGGRAGPARPHRDRRRRRPGRVPGDHGPQPGPGRTQIGTRHRPGQPRKGACAVSITVAKFRDVAEGVQPGQFMIGDREPVASLADLDPIYKRLLDEPVNAIVAVTGSAGQPKRPPGWFDYDGS